ncbi:hypothetical protein H0H93_008863 [Arthromyces matolae]|nr:hypothetical protein H0H93_008863 [Arthromyces matolae]
MAIDWHIDESVISLGEDSATSFAASLGEHVQIAVNVTLFPDVHHCLIMLLCTTTQRSVSLPFTMTTAATFDNDMLAEAQLRVELNDAITNGDFDRTTFVLDKLSAIVSSPPPSDTVVLATKIGSLTIVNLLLSQGADISDDAVLEAISTGRIDFLQAFFDSGRWDVRLRFGGHLGDILTFTKRPAVIEWALHHGADPNKNRDGVLYYPLERAVSANRIDCAKVLIAGGAHVKGTYALIDAAQAGSTSMISLLLESGADVNEIPPDKYTGSPWQGTPLHEAAKKGHLPAVQLLLDRGADPTLKDTDGKIALDLARARNHVSIVEILEGQLFKLVTTLSTAS